MNIPESDWKIFKRVHPLALERLCERILEESRKICDTKNLSAHKRYLRLYRHIEKRDKDIAQAFNDYRRSTAILCLRAMYFLDLLTDEDLEQFSDQVQDMIQFEL